MYNILVNKFNNVVPKVKQLTGTITFLDGNYKDKYAKYNASFPNREHLVVYNKEDDSIVTSIFITKGKSKGIETENVVYYGDLNSYYLGILGMSDDIMDYDTDIDEKPKRGLANKLRGIEYKNLNTSENGVNISGNIEDVLYKNIPFDVITKDKDMSWLKDKDYRLLTKREDILEWIEGLKVAKDFVGFDTETSGLRVNRTRRDVLVGLCMSYEDDKGIYIPLQHLRIKNSEIPLEELLELLKPYFDKHSKLKKKVVGHNLKFDWGVMKMHGWELEITEDTYIRQCILQVSSAKNVFTLKGIVSRMLGIDVAELSEMYEQITKKELAEISDLVLNKGAKVNEITRYKFQSGAKDFKKDMVDFRFADEDFSRVYGGADGDFPRLLIKEMIREQSEEGSKWNKGMENIYRLELELIQMIGEQEFYGVKVVPDKFEILNNKALIRKEKLQEKIFELAGEKFNINSSQQKSEILFGKMGIPTKKRYKTKSGALGTGKNVLEDLDKYKNNDGSPKYPIVSLLQKYSKNEKLISSFYSNLPKLVTDGYIFPNYHTVKAETGRLSCTSPNIQQTEPTSRNYMIPDTDDHYLLICDFSQVEYRLMSGLSHEMKVVNFFKNNPEADYHILAYANMMGKKYEDVTSKERKMGKILNFGTSYGLEDQNLALQLFGNDDAISQRLASKARDDYFGGVPTLRDYFEAVRDKAEITGETVTLFGRVRSIPEFHGMDGKLIDANRLSDFKRGSGRRKAGNMPVQGTAADIMKMAMVRLKDRFRKYGLYEDKARAVLNVHDEVCYCIHKSVHPWLATAIMREAMEVDFSAYGIPPLYVGANVGYSWRDGKVDELEAPVILMDRECKKAMDKYKEHFPELKEGKSLERLETVPEIDGLPYIEDPRTFWLDEVSRFALEVISYEVNKGLDITEEDSDGNVKVVGHNPIKTLADARKSVRINKYSNHFGNLSTLVVAEMVEHKGEEGFFKEMFDYWNMYKEYKSPLAKRLVEESKDLIKERGVTDLDTLLKDKDIHNKLNYFGEGSDGYSYKIAEALINGEDWEMIVGKNEELKSTIEYAESLVEDLTTLCKKENIESIDELEEYYDIRKLDKLGEYKELFIKNIVDYEEDVVSHMRKDLLKGKNFVLPKEKKVAKTIEERRETIKTALKENVKRSKERKILQVTLNENDYTLNSIIDSLLLKAKSINNSNNYSGNKDTLRIVLPDGEVYIKNGWFLPQEHFIYLKRALLIHFAYIDTPELLNYNELQEEIMEMLRDNKVNEAV